MGLEKLSYQCIIRAHCSNTLANFEIPEQLHIPARNPDFEQMVEKAQALDHSYARCLPGKRKTASILSPPLQNWQPLEKRKLKINIDGAYLAESSEGAVAMVCRDSNGRLIDGFAGKIFASSPEMVEAQALIHALTLLII